jgi:hypothetical protein
MREVGQLRSPPSSEPIGLVLQLRAKLLFMSMMKILNEGPASGTFGTKHCLDVPLFFFC